MGNQVGLKGRALKGTEGHEASSRCRDWRWGVTCGVLALLAGGCSISDELTAVRKEQKSTSPAQFVAFQQALDAEAILAASDWMELGDGVKVTTDGDAIGIANTGIGSTNIGTDALVGDVWAAGTVTLRDRARVAGAVRAKSVVRGNQTTIENGTFPAPTQKTPLDLSVPAFEAPKPAVSLEPNQILDLAPGNYQALEVKPGARVTLTGGNYRFGSVMIHNGGSLHFEDECDVSNIYVVSAFTFRGAITADSSVEPAVFTYLGTTTAQIEAPFRGAVLAPNAELVLNSATHLGRFAAKRLRVQSWAKVKGLSSDDDGQCEAKSAPQSKPSAIVPKSIGPAPELINEGDLDEFLEWYYHIRPEHLQEARDAIAGVSNNTSVLNGLIARFDLARSARSIGKGAMLLSLVGCMDLPAAEGHLIGVLNEPLPNVPDDSDDPKTTMFSSLDYEIAFRAKALTVLLTRGTSEAKAAVLNVAKNHPSGELRGHAIQALAYGLSDAERAQLKGQLRLEDERYIYRPHRTDPDFETKVQHYVSTY